MKIQPSKPKQKISFFLTPDEKTFLKSKLWKKGYNSQEIKQIIKERNDYLNKEALKLRKKKNETPKQYEKRQKEHFDKKFHEMCMREEAKRR